MNDVLRGVLFSLGGNIAISIGDHLKVFGEQKNGDGKKLYHGHGKSYKKNQRFAGRCSSRFMFGCLGYMVMIMGQICNGYALAFAPQTLLATIGSIQFIMNLICSAILMSRPIKLVHIIGTVSIITGCLIMIFGFSPKADQSQLTVYALFYNFNSPHYRNYLVVVVLVFLFSIVWQYIEANYISKRSMIYDDDSSPKTLKHRKKRTATPRTDKNMNSWSNSVCCMDTKLISGFFYSFSSAMAGTQSVVLGKTMAIIIRNYIDGRVVMFDPLDLFVLCFILIVFASYIITFVFWLYRRTESMVLFDTVFIAPLNQVMWLTFSTVAGGIYFHEFENAHTMQWIALISGMLFNYLGLYYLVPTAADQPILIINMEKPPKKKKVDDDLNTNRHHMNQPQPTPVDNIKLFKPMEKTISNEHAQPTVNEKLRVKQTQKRRHVQQIDNDSNNNNNAKLHKHRRTNSVFIKCKPHSPNQRKNDEQNLAKYPNLSDSDDSDIEDSYSTDSESSSGYHYEMETRIDYDSNAKLANVTVDVEAADCEQAPLLHSSRSSSATTLSTKRYEDEKNADKW
eukprot:CAMPEP_0197024770 /NCGR_PEP_ID=MMETSP1384-20130603/5268_1 /TAXON_ID=29189 /ORGANISM="Ammonia sp." /LENGTH=565 /DNA_ID=CAMNT_0042453213 /DNA_START=32 /DNA_END=1726 /DNA_ORIENTATION=-